MVSHRSGFRPLSPPRNLTDELVSRLSAEINSGKLSPQDRLPTEQEMIAAFGVSRTVVREAISALRAEGLVESRQGAGVFVARDMRRRPFRIDPESGQTIAGILDILELRKSVEIEAAGLAAERHKAADLRAIEKSLEAFRRAIDHGESGVDADFEFHHAICKATGNPYFLQFLEFLGRFIIPRQSIRVELESQVQHKAYLARVLAEHEAICEAIRASDAGAARRAMRAHLTKSRERYRELAATHDLD